MTARFSSILSITSPRAVALAAAVLSIGLPSAVASVESLAAARPMTTEGEMTDAWSSAGAYLAGQTVAARFTLAATASIESIVVWGASSNLSTPGLDNVAGVEVVIWDEAFTTSLLAATIPVSSLSAAPTGEVTRAGGIQYEITIPGWSEPALPAGVYHLNVGAVLADGMADPFQWSTSSGGALYWNEFDGAGWIEDADIATPAFELFGAVVAADLDLDGVVGGADLGVLLASWGPCAACDGTRCAADLDGDCMVDGSDLGLLLSAWD